MLALSHSTSDAFVGLPIPSLHGLRFAVRLVHDFGIANILFATGLSSADKMLIPANSIVLVKDHVNISGSNPLFGDNEAKWGPRFPDMGNAYNAEYRRIMQGQHPHQSQIGLSKFARLGYVLSLL